MASVERATGGFDVSKHSKASPSEQKSRDSPWIRYRVNYRNEKTSELIYETVGDQASTLGAQNISAGEGTPSFEVIKLLYTYQDKETNESNASHGTTPPPVTNSSPPHYSIRIHSPAIINALHSVVKYYPGVNLTETPLTLDYPYMILCHHYDELDRFAVACQERDPSTACELEKGADVPISLLLRYLDGCVMPQVRAEQERLRRGRYTWQWEWVGLQPGRTVMQSTREREEWDALVVQKVTGGPFPTDTQPASNRWTIYYWALDFNGVHLGRVRKCATSASWDGEDVLADNMVYLNLAEDVTEPTHPLAQEAIRLGSLYWAMVESRCQWHAGKGVDFPHNEINALVMVDPKAYLAHKPDDLEPQMDASDELDWVTNCDCKVCSNRKENNMTWDGDRRPPPFRDYNRLTPLMARHEPLSWHHYFLCPKAVHAFVFRTRHWEKLAIKNLRNPTFDKGMIDFLEMESKQLYRLKALATAYCRRDKAGNEISRPSWSADFVQGKGKGLTFLLHGKPGVGKTWTAECIAEFMESPLMILNTSDIGTDAETIEDNLTRNFKQAKNWGAVLLIDEADIFMERRSTRNLERNALVAGFLRALEFYGGILFLTTNRVGAFDDAFISRIHVQLYYKDFTDTQRQKIWHNFADKLKRERGDSIRLNIEAREYLQGSTLRALKWNGREIRNAFQTAVSLAEYEAIPDPIVENAIQVTEEHFKAVVELSQDFKEYLDELHDKNEADRAAARQERLDNYGDV